MAQLWKSFMEALAPPQHNEQQQGEGVALNRMVGGHPLSRHEQPTSHAEGPGSRAPPEYQEVIHSDLNVDPARETQSTRVEDEQDSDVEFRIQGKLYLLDPWQTPLLFQGSLLLP